MMHMIARIMNLQLQLYTSLSHTTSPLDSSSMPPTFGTATNPIYCVFFSASLTAAAVAASASSSFTLSSSALRASRRARPLVTSSAGSKLAKSALQPFSMT